MANITNTLTATLTATEDTSGSVVINRAIGTFYDCTSSRLFEYNLLGAGPNGITVTPSPSTVIYVKNLDATKTITVQWTPNGGAQATIIVLNPGDLILLFANPAGATTPGITSLVLTPSAVNAVCEILIGG